MYAFCGVQGSVGLGAREASGAMQAVRGGGGEFGELLALVCRLPAESFGGMKGEVA